MTRRWSLAVAGAAVITMFAIGTALAVHESGFQLEGNATEASLHHGTLDPDGKGPLPAIPAGDLAPPYNGAYDWDSLFNIEAGAAPGNSLGTVSGQKASLPGNFTGADFEKDFSNTGTTFLTFDTTTFATGSKDTLDISGWQCNRDANVNSKVDIMNGFAAIQEVGGEKYFYYGLEKAKNTGDNNVALWLFQDKNVGCVTAGPTYPTTTFSGLHTNGDLLVVSAFTNGGGVSNISIYEWLNGALVPVPPAGIDCLVTGAGDDACATVNQPDTIGGSETVKMPWLTADNGVINAEHPSPNFFEGGINLSAFPEFADVCFNRYLLNTRSSQSLTATLFDYVQGNISTCRTPATTLTTKSVTAAPIMAGQTVTVVVTETNSGTDPLTNANVTGGGKCTSFSPASVATLAVGATADFTCTFTADAGTNNWSADGHATDSHSNPAPDAGEHTSGSITGLTASTSLTLVSVTPAPIMVGDTVTVVVNEKNTGTAALHDVSVTGGGKCTSFTGGATTLAAGADADFTCTFTAVAGANAWSADGQGKDPSGASVPATGEHQEGSITGLTASTSLVTKSQTPAGPVLPGTLVTVVVTETNTGTAALTNVNVTGGGSCTTFSPANVATLAAGASADFTCTFTAANPGTTYTWFADGHGTDPNGQPAPSTGEHASGSITTTTPGEGCTPGFWKNHTTLWDQASDPTSAKIAAAITALGAPYSGNGTTTASFWNTFGIDGAHRQNLSASLTLLDAVSLGGGQFRALARHGTAALLSSAPTVDYPYTPAQVLQGVHDAFMNNNYDLKTATFPNGVLTDLTAANNLPETSCNSIQ